MSETHKVITDALQTLGSIIGESEKRDAIHLAAEPVVAAHPLRPGEHVGFVDGGVGLCSNPVGIVDPFLRSYVDKGQRFWLIVYPRKITSLRHVWEHPGFPASGEIITPATPSKSTAEQWLRDFAERADLSYNQVIEAGKTYIATGEHFVQRDQESARDAIYENGALEAFWNNFEIVTGIKVEDREGTVFCCSC